MNKECMSCKEAAKKFLHLGRQPIANGFLDPSQFKDEYFFDLSVAFCEKCGLVQLSEQPAPERMFNENYAFFSGTSKYMAVHFEKFAAQIMDRYLKGIDNPFVTEIGSNDGIMLRNFKNSGIRHLGVEPSSNVADVAKKQGINTVVKFFNEKTATEIVAEHGQADAFVAANVMCHLPDLHTIAKGLKILLKPRGVISFEDPYLGDVIEKTSYDQIYDEHMCLFSAISIMNHFRQYGFELIDVEAQVTHGGSMRYYLAHKGSHPVHQRVVDLIQKEETLGLMKLETYESFRKNCEQSKSDLIELLIQLKKEKKRVVGYAATSKSTTVINYCGVTPDLLEYICDTTPIKQGKFSPGKHIPIVPHKFFQEKYPDYAVLFGWNHKKEIMEKETEFLARGGKWIVFIPQVEVLQ